MNDKYVRNISKFNHNIKLFRLHSQQDATNATNYENFYFNVKLSDQLPFDRNIPDTRYSRLIKRENRPQLIRKTHSVGYFFSFPLQL
jgi:hypothetical protein